jgi:hypothetical protein
VPSGQGPVLRPGAGTPTAAEEIAQGTEATRQAGERFGEPPDAVHTGRNPGDTPAVLPVSGLVADQPFLQPIRHTKHACRPSGSRAWT